MMRGAIALAALLVAANAGAGGETQVFGRWRVVDHMAPGVSAMSPEQANGWIGKRAEYSATRAKFDRETCDTPRYVVKQKPAEQYFIDGFRIDAKEVGITAGTVTVVQIVCPVRWTVPGGMLIVKSRARLLTVWDGVFFELARAK